MVATENEVSMIAIKPHHFVDIITWFGDGHSSLEPHPFGHALHSVAESIIGNLDLALRIEIQADDICLPCRHNNQGRCGDTIDTSFRPAAPKSKLEWNLLIDRRWCTRLGLRQNDRLTVRDLCELLRDHAGDIGDIYREVPKDRTAVRQAKLEKGIARLLRQSQDDHSA
jgi:hypothetical protein